PRPQRRGARTGGALSDPCLARTGPRSLRRAEYLDPSPGLTPRKPMPLAPYQVVAFNTAHDSENKIHDDATARRFGFGGGLVPGVDVYGYMTHLPVLRGGRDWLDRGATECRFMKPVYDGDTVVVTATEDGGALEIAVESRGVV